MNSIIITGRLTAKPELKYTASGKCLCQFSLACTGMSADTDFIDCVVWNKQAENLCEYQEKGNLIGVAGRLSTDTYQNKEGQKVKKYVVSVSTLEFMSSKPKTQEAKVVEPEQNPFEEFGNSVTIDDNFLD